MEPGVTIRRNLEPKSYPFKKVFEGFESVGAVRSIFGGPTSETLDGVQVVLEPRRGYLRVNGETGNIEVSLEYLKSGDERYIYLDVIHELVHVRQFMEGKELYDRSFSYVDRPTEIEAYKAAVKEAKRIGMTHDDISEYLWVEWISPEEFQRLIVNSGLG